MLIYNPAKRDEAALTVTEEGIRYGSDLKLVERLIAQIAGPRRGQGTPLSRKFFIVGSERVILPVSVEPEGEDHVFPGGRAPARSLPDAIAHHQTKTDLFKSGLLHALADEGDKARTARLGPLGFAVDILSRGENGIHSIMPQGNAYCWTGPFSARRGLATMVDGTALLVGTVTGVIGALVGAFFGARLALRTVRRQREHEIKQGAYGTLLPLIEETIDLMGWIHGHQGLTFEDDKKFIGLLIQLLKPVYLLGDRDAFHRLDQLEDESDLKTKKGRQEYLEGVRTYVISFLLMEAYSNIREVRLSLGSLRFAPPEPAVKEALDRVLALLAGDEVGVGMRGMLRHTDFAEALPEVDLRARAEAYRVALSSLQQAILADLGKSL